MKTERLFMSSEDTLYTVHNISSLKRNVICSYQMKTERLFMSSEDMLFITFLDSKETSFGIDLKESCRKRS